MARVLVADDEEHIRLAFRLILEQEGHEVEEAADGAEAVAACRARCPDVLVTDLFMPDKDGFEVLREVLPDCPGLRVICVSGSCAALRSGAVDSLLRAARRLGALQVLTKPVTAADLVAAVASVLAAQTTTPPRQC